MMPDVSELRQQAGAIEANLEGRFAAADAGASCAHGRKGGSVPLRKPPAHPVRVFQVPRTRGITCSAIPKRMPNRSPSRAGTAAGEAAAESGDVGGDSTEVPLA